MEGKKTSGGFKNIADKAARGEYTLVDPLDYLIIEHLKEEGTMFAGVYPEGHTVKQVARERFEDQIPTAVLAPRFAILSAQKLIVGQKGIGSGGNAVYQRTPLGKKLYLEWAAARTVTD